MRATPWHKTKYRYDYKFKITKAYKNFWDNEIEYRQEGGPTCTLYAAIGVLSDLTGIKFDPQERKDMWKLCEQAGADGTGFSLEGAARVVRDYYNSYHLHKVEFVAVHMHKKYVLDVLKKGYSVLLGIISEGKEFNKDKYDDFIINGVKFPRGATGHALRITKLDDEYVLAIDNRISKTGKNTKNRYKIPIENLDDLAKSQSIQITSGFYHYKQSFDDLNFN